ncbi:uncharacterized protein VP01_1491g3 [Puccinia sorghi]|uniref:Uncharacterized protein n=1 Tax=Puccinia sorghi TaxID=27349 RepID=A0A0L6VJI2_9BASI|nr:uncharacterized protein VP01_1491g3 [Puccinia sorghi]
MNRVEIYGRSCSESAKLTQTLIQLASQLASQLATNHQPNQQLDHQQPNQNEQICKLTTKYYQAELYIKYLPLEITPPTSSPQAILIQWGTQQKVSHIHSSNLSRKAFDHQKQEHLSAFLKPFQSSQSHSRLVIVHLDPETLEEDQEWHEICFQYGFECHSSSDLAQASMSWQCCPWPNIHPYSSSKSINNNNPLLIDQSNPQVHPGEELKFEDDFDEFVSAETGATTQWDKLEEEEDISAAEVDEMVSTLFGPDGPSDAAAPLGDLESLLGNLHRLKLQAASLDLSARQRLASRVALAVQSRLDPDH